MKKFRVEIIEYRVENGKLVAVLRGGGKVYEAVLSKKLKKIKEIKWRPPEVRKIKIEKEGLLRKAKSVKVK